MSWSGTYSHNVLLGVDFLGAIVFWNVEDITISSLCGLVMNYDKDPSGWQRNLDMLKLYEWQISVLRWLGPKLNDIKANHCQLAIEADTARAKHAIAVLTLSVGPTPA